MSLLRRPGFLLVFWVALAGGSCVARPADTTREEGEATEPILVLVSLDGWRWDYADRASTPNLDALAARGVAAEALVPVFPPKTFPNHYTIVTGLYPERHGIVSNTMDDAAIGERFELSAPSVLDPRWWGGEPIWTTAERQGQRAATVFWPGSDVEIGGRRPTRWLAYDGSVPNARRVEQALEWLALPEDERPTFLTLYFSAVDTVGHQHGPDSREVLEAAERVDGLLGDLVVGVGALGLLDRTVIAVTSDHGMSQLSPERVVFLDDYIDLSRVSVTEWSPVLGLSPTSGSIDEVYSAISGRHPSLTIYKRENVPAELHHSAHARIPPIVGIADDGWTITSRARFERQRAGGDLNGGAHGYLPSHPSMHGIFVAAGPGLRQGLRVPAFANVHLYELLCAILGIEPAPNDGDPAVTRPLLVNQAPGPRR